MKKVAVLFLLVWLIQPCFSQQNQNSYFDEVGVMIGPGYSMINGGESWSGTLGLQIGLESQVYKMNENSSFYAGILLSLQGASYEETYTYDPYDYYPYRLKSAMDETSYKGKVSLAYISFPMLYNYKFDQGFYIEGGIQPGFLISAKDKPDEGSSYDFKDNTKSFDLGIPVGAGFWINDRLCVGARAVFGITQINKDTEMYSSEDTDRNFLLLGVARYNFHKNK